MAALLGIAVTSLALARVIFQKTSGADVQTRRKDDRAGEPRPLSSGDERDINALGPLLFAAETGAHADGTSTLSDEELEKLEFDLRMLVTNMDSQLMEVLEDIVAMGIPSEAMEELERITVEINEMEDRLTSPAAQTDHHAFGNGTEVDNMEDGLVAHEKSISELRWKAFAVIQPYAEDSMKRQYRSLLTNREIQATLLRQVEKQTVVRSQTSDASSDPESSSSKAEETFNNKKINGTGKTTIQPLQCFSIAGCSLPHPFKAHTGGEDAFFAVESKGVFGVADGVGGWSEMGIDPAEYPRKLMKSAEKTVLQENEECIDPLFVLKRAFAEAHAPGSCTVSLASLCPHHHETSNAVGPKKYELRIVSLGDCATHVVRDGAIIFETKVQEHSFNQPFQISSPQYYVGGSGPEDAAVYSTRVQSGDIVVMGSDGLFDNLWGHELESIVTEMTQNVVHDSEFATTRLADESDSTAVSLARSSAELVAEEISHKVATVASEHSRDISYASPFAAERHERTVPPLLRSALPPPRGGKLDDITAVVCVVK